MSAITDELDKITAALGALYALVLPESSHVIYVSAGASLQTAVDTAQDGAILVLEPGIYPGTLTLNRPITIRSAADVPAGRIQTATINTWIVGTDQGVIVTGPDVTLLGLGIKSSNPNQTLVDVTGPRFTLDRCGVLGGPDGQHRGVQLNGAGAALWGCVVDGCWLPGREAQAVAGWDGTRDIVISDCFLAGGSQAVLFGGADSSSADRVPTHIQIMHSTLTKDPGWAAKGAQVKCAFELKSAIDVSLTDCVLEYAGTSGGQGAYLILLTVRNQDGTAPWSTVQNVTIERCLCRYGGGCVNILGLDDHTTSVGMTNVTIRNVAFTNIDHLGPTGGNGRGIQFMGAPDRVTIEACTIEAQHLLSQMYFIAPAPTNLVLKNLKMSPSEYGLKIDDGGSGVAAVQAFAPDAVIQIAATDAGASGYPT